MDSSPDITGRALKGAFNASEEREKLYNEYFEELREIYKYKFQLLKALVKGINSINDETIKNRIIEEVKNQIPNEEELNKILSGLLYTDFPNNLEPESGFFAILDFTKKKE